MWFSEYRRPGDHVTMLIAKWPMVGPMVTLARFYKRASGPLINEHIGTGG